MSEEVIDALLVKLGVTVDQASFSESTSAVNGLDNAINRAARNRGKTGIDQIGKNMAETGSNADRLEQVVDRLDRTVARTPRSIGVLQSRLGSATQQMSSFRKETQTVVALLSRGASATGMGPLSGGMFAMLASGGVLGMATAGIGALAANSFAYTNGALRTEVSSSTFGVSKSDYQNFNRFGKKVTGEDDVGTQILSAAQKIKMSSSVGSIPVEVARYGASPADFADAYKKPTLDVVDLIQKQLRNASDPVLRQGIGNALGINQAGIMTLDEDYRTGIRQADKPGSTYTDRDVANAKAFENSLVDLTADFERLRNKLGADFLPSLDNFVKRIDGMFAQGGLADRIGDFANKIGSGDFKGAVEALKDKNVKSAVSGFVKDHVPLVDIAKGAYQGAVSGYEKDGIVGGYKGAVGGYFNAIGDQFPAARNLLSEGYDSARQAVLEKMPSAHIDDDLSKPLRPEYLPRPKEGVSPEAQQSDESKAAAQQRALKHFTENGYTSQQAFGIVANLTDESQMNTGAIGDGGSAYGLAQWHPDRQQDFKDFFGKDIKGSSEKDQLDFVLYELQNKERAAGLALSKAKTAAESADIFRRMYERPKDNPANSLHRMQVADQLSNSSNLPDLPPLAQRSSQAAGGAALPSDIPETYNMVANPPAPPSIDLIQGQQGAQEGNTVHIDARGSTDVNHITSQALKAATDHFQGQLTISMSHLSEDLDQ